MKPIVRYHDCMPPVLGEPARVFPMDHPIASNTRWVRTSPVQMIVTETPRGPIFETVNTRWVPASDWKSATPNNLQSRYA